MFAKKMKNEKKDQKTALTGTHRTFEHMFILCHILSTYQLK